jgi:hypothetical protein
MSVIDRMFELGYRLCSGTTAIVAIQPTFIIFNNLKILEVAE